MLTDVRLSLALLSAAWLALAGIASLEPPAPAETLDDRDPAPLIAPRDEPPTQPPRRLPKPRPVDRDELLALARICASEAGIRVTDDCAAIHAVITHRSALRGMSWLGMARAYSSRVFDADRSDDRRWIAGLRLDAERPRGWPAGMRWRGRWRGRWIDLVDHARRILRGDERARCKPEHWGAPYGADLQRALDAGWTRLGCGDTRNAFWRT